MTTRSLRYAHLRNDADTASSIVRSSSAHAAAAAEDDSQPLRQRTSYIPVMISEGSPSSESGWTDSTDPPLRGRHDVIGKECRSSFSDLDEGRNTTTITTKVVRFRQVVNAQDDVGGVSSSVRARWSSCPDHDPRLPVQADIVCKLSQSAARRWGHHRSSGP